LYILAFICSSVSHVIFSIPRFATLAPAHATDLKSHLPVSIGLSIMLPNQATIFQALQGTLAKVHQAYSFQVSSHVYGLNGSA
jgi:hypothetical protein